MRDVQVLVALEPAGKDRFRSVVAQRNQRKNQFGGQLMALAIEAAGRTAGDRSCHAVSGHFLRAGDVTLPIEIAIERSLDGGSFTMRRASLWQRDQCIFQLEASFQRDESGFARAIDAPLTRPPGQLTSNADLDPVFVASLTPLQARRIYVLPGVDIRAVEPREYFAGRADGRRSVWMRAPSAAGAAETTQRALLAYLTDFVLASTATLPQEDEDGMRPISASLNQSMWFYRPHSVDRWVRLECDTPTAQNGRGIGRADLFDEAGRIVASTVQEVLIRRAGFTPPR